MGVPGFTAEASAYRSSETYSLAASFTSSYNGPFLSPALRAGGNGAAGCALCMGLCWLVCTGVGESNCTDRCWNICCVETAVAGRLGALT